MGLPKKLILCSLALIFCVGIFWTFLIYKANRTIDQLKSDDWQVREKARQSLIKLGKPAVGPLITALKDKDEDIRWRAAYGLGEIKDSRAIEPLVTALNDEDSRVRYRTIEALGKIGDKHCIELLIGALKDKNIKDLDVQQTVVNALVTIGKPAVESVITVLETDDDNYTRIKAVEILGRIGDKRAMEPLITALKDSNGLVRIEVVEALYHMRDRRGVELLIAALKDENFDVQLKVIWVLEGMTGKKFGQDIEKWQNWWEENKDKFTKQE